MAFHPRTRWESKPEGTPRLFRLGLYLQADSCSGACARGHRLYIAGSSIGRKIGRLIILVRIKYLGFQVAAVLTKSRTRDSTVRAMKELLWTAKQLFSR